jgi:hypothetical protein
VEKPEIKGDFRQEQARFGKKTADFGALFSPPENDNPRWRQPRRPPAQTEPLRAKSID